jgi:hypothetical protein
VIGRPLLPYLVRKEIRALAPTWCGCAAVIAMAGLWRDSQLLVISAFAYGLGCVALGAQSFGQEYSYRTVGLLLAQPVSRRRIFFTKIATTAAMVVALTIVAWPVVFAEARWFGRAPRDQVRLVLLLSAFAATCIAPVLSIVCRSVLAAIVLTAALPGALLVAADVVGVGLYGVAQAATVDRFKYAVFWRGMFLACAAGAAACWWMFARLEAIDGRGAEFHLPSWRGWRKPRGASAGHSSPIRQLVSKELRLYQVAVPVVALYIGAYFLVARVARDVPAVADPIPALSMLYAALLGMLIGALASAEERHMGTLEWQTLLPIPAWKQWAIKTCVVAALVLVLGVALPYALRIMSPVVGDPLAHQPPTEILNMIIIVMVLTSVSLYVSSLTASGVRALVVSLPALAAAIAAINVVAWIAAKAMGVLGVGGALRSLFSIHNTPAAAVIALGFVLLAASFAAVNHRSAERPITRIAMQASALIAYVSAFAMLFRL